MVTFPRMFSAIGHHFTACFHSFLLFFSGGARKNLGFLLSFGGQTEQPGRLRSSATSDAAAEDVIAPSTSTQYPSSEDFSLQDIDAGDRYSDFDFGDDEMASTASSVPRKAALPKIIPALPLVLLPCRRDSSTAKATNQDVEHLRDGLKLMQLNGLAPTEQQQESAVRKVTSPAQVISNGLEKENKDVKGKGKERALEHSTQILQDSPRKEVVRSPPVPIVHEISQNSNLKEIKPVTDSYPPLGPDVVETLEQAAERAIHSGFMRDALDMARLALKTNETPVGCVLVYRGRIIAKGMNATNISRNGTRHAELMAVSALLSYSPASDLEDKKGSSAKGKKGRGMSKQNVDVSTWGDVDPTDGHLFPYGQKLHPSPRVDRSVIHECTLYVTVEPCIMCASLLRQLGIKKVYFGAVNDKFGGTGGVFRIHKNSPHSVASTPPSPAPQNGKGLARPVLERRPASTTNLPDCQASSGDEKSEVPIEPLIDPSTLPGDGGNIERGYDVEGGWGRDEAVTLLRQFYVQENGRAPVPRKKEGRAARLAAMMERDGHAGGPMIDANAVKGKSSSDNGDASADDAKDGECVESPVDAVFCEASGGDDKEVDIVV